MPDWRWGRASCGPCEPSGPQGPEPHRATIVPRGSDSEAVAQGPGRVGAERADRRNRAQRTQPRASMRDVGVAHHAAVGRGRPAGPRARTGTVPRPGSSGMTSESLAGLHVRGGDQLAHAVEVRDRQGQRRVPHPEGAARPRRGTRTTSRRTRRVRRIGDLHEAPGALLVGGRAVRTQSSQTFPVPDVIGDRGPHRSPGGSHDPLARGANPTPMPASVIGAVVPTPSPRAHRRWIGGDA